MNYSSLSASNKNFAVYTDLTTLDPGNPSNVIGTTVSLSFNGYRWHVTSYGKQSSGVTQSFGSGIFTLNSNFAESYLHYSYTTNAAGSEDLVILVGLDSSGNNLTPDSFLFVSGNPSVYKTRGLSTNNLDKTPSSSKDINWSKDALSVTLYRIWLFIGYRDSSNGRLLNMTNIAFS